MPRKKSEELGKREKDILAFIEKQIKENGYPPSVREIGKSVGLSSTATVHGYLTKLEQKGYIKKENQKGRTLRLLKGTKNSNENKRNRLFLSGKDFGSQNYIDYLCGKCTEQEMVRAGGWGQIRTWFFDRNLR